MSAYTIHPAANIFPMMSGDELEGLIKDIDENGQREPVTFWNGQLLDGRNRALACARLGKELDACELDSETDPIKWVVSHNLHRRHLTTSQRSMVAARIRDIYDEQAKEKSAATVGRPKNGADKSVEKLPPIKARDTAGAAVNVSGKLVDAATTVLERGSKELIAKVDSGEVSVSKAASVAKAHDKRSQVAALNDPPPKKPERNVFTELRKVFDGMTVAERKQAAVMWEQWLDDES